MQYWVLDLWVVKKMRKICIYTYILYTHTYIFMNTHCVYNPEEGTGSPGSGVISCELACRYWNWTQVPSVRIACVLSHWAISLAPLLQFLKIPNWAFLLCFCNSGDWTLVLAKQGLYHWTPLALNRCFPIILVFSRQGFCVDQVGLCVRFWDEAYSLV